MKKEIKGQLNKPEYSEISKEIKMWRFRKIDGENFAVEFAKQINDNDVETLVGIQLSFKSLELFMLSLVKFGYDMNKELKLNMESFKELSKSEISTTKEGE